MYFFKPEDEMSLRHLFENEYVQNRTKLYYVGPVLSDGGVKLTSPDALVLDRSGEKEKVLRAEFKFNLDNGAADFAHNGQFDLAVVWQIPDSWRDRKDQLAQDLLKQNGCRRIVSLADSLPSKSLLDYNLENIALVSQFPAKEIENFLVEREPHFVWPLLVAAKISPGNFKLKRLTELLEARFAIVKAMDPRGRANVTTAFFQKTAKFQFIKHMFADSYTWNNSINAAASVVLLEVILRERFKCPLPSEDELKAALEG